MHFSACTVCVCANPYRNWNSSTAPGYCYVSTAGHTDNHAQQLQEERPKQRRGQSKNEPRQYLQVSSQTCFKETTRNCLRTQGTPLICLSKRKENRYICTVLFFRRIYCIFPLFYLSVRTVRYLYYVCYSVCVVIIIVNSMHYIHFFLTISHTGVLVNVFYVLKSGVKGALKSGANRITIALFHSVPEAEHFMRLSKIICYDS